MNYLTPDQWLAALVILGITLGLTELVKRIYRKLEPELHGDAWVPRLLSVLFGMGIGAYVWPDGGVIDPVWMGLFIGATSPALYKIAVVILDKKFPGVAAAISGRKPDDNGPV